jgi:hypothetical protein
LKSIEREVEEDRDMAKSERDKQAERTGSKAATKEKKTVQSDSVAYVKDLAKST